MSASLGNTSMVITCPSCAARYRLNPDKIQGRGAKITCPKCSHVFVVFTENEEGAEAGAPKVRATPRPAAPPPAAPVTSPREKRKATQTGAFKAVGIDIGDVHTSKRDVRIVAPGPRSTRRVTALSKPAAEVPRRPESAAPEPSAADVTIENAGDLDFRAVGIKTWKVKVAIGLIYDFSDIATLQKYLADKKVTPDDLISHNNSDWTRIGDIEDLEQHFVDVWREAKAAIDRGDAPKPAPRKKTNPGAAAPAGTTTDSFRVDQSRGRVSGTYGTPPAAAAARRRRAAAEPEETGNKRALWILAALVIVGLPLAWLFRPQDAPVVTAPPPPPTIEELGPSDEELEKIRQSIADKIEKEREKLENELADPEEGLVDGEPEERRLEPVPPSERRLEPVTPPPRVSPNPTPRPKYTPPPKPEVADATPAPSGTIREKKGDPARMYLDAGKKKLASGDFGSAKSMFLAAIKKNGQCGQCYEGLAEAEKQLGNAEAAAEAQRKANQLGNTQSLARP